MSRRALLLLSLIPLLLIPLLLDEDRAPRPPAAWPEARSELAQLLEEAEPGSAEHQSLSRALHRVRRKAAQTAPRAEDPGAFYEALASIRQTESGESYPGGHRSRVLEAARRLGKRVDGPLPWLERGPGNVAGRTRAVIVDAADPTEQTWLAGTIGGGIWKTTDAGASWFSISPDFTSLSVGTLAQCASQPEVIYAGTGMGYGRVVDLEGSGVWKIVDGGDTWQQLPSTSAGQVFEAVNRIVVDPEDPDVVVLCSNNSFSHLGPQGGDKTSGIFRSVDGGQTWTQTFDPVPLFTGLYDNRVQQIVANPQNFRTLYATVNEIGVVRSRDGGITWEVSADDFALASDIGNPPGGGTGLNPVSVRTEMAVSPTDTSRLYAAVERPRGVADLFMSTDAGDSWVRVDDLSGDPNWFNAFGESGITGAYTAGWFDNTIAVHPYDEDVVFVGGVNLYRLDVDPTTATRTSTAIGWWIPNTDGIPVVHADHHFLTMIPKSAATQSFWILDANDGGVGLSKDGGASFVQLANLGSTQFYGADRRVDQPVYIGGMQDNGTWQSGVDPSATSAWSPKLGGDGFEVAVNGRDGNLVLGGSQFGNLSRSTDGGATWTAIPEAKRGNAPFISKIANNDVDPDLVFTVGTDGLGRSTDFGLSWTTVALPGSWLGYRPFDNVEVGLADPQVVWAHSRLAKDPATGRRGGVYVSDDGGLSFSNVTGDLPSIGLLEASGVATHPLERDTAYLLFGAPGLPKILRTTDRGQTWQDLSGYSAPAKTMGLLSPNGFPDVAVFSLLVMPFDPDVIWAGTEIGLFVSEDAGASWALSTSGLPSVAIFEMKIVDDEVVVATQGRGVWTVALPELATWTPPPVTLAPRLTRFALLPTGELGLEVELRSPYDSTRVTVDGVLVEARGPNAEPETLDLRLPVTSTQTRLAEVTSLKDGRSYRSAQRTATVFPAEPRNRYVNDFASASAGDDFIGGGFGVVDRFGFSSRAIHSLHSYPAATDLTYMLRVPILVDAQSSQLHYRDVALIEEGVASDWRDVNFFDYVVVEGSSDGVQWEPLAPGYDSRANPAWSSAYRAGLLSNGDSNTQGDESLYVEHTLDLRDTFTPGEHVFVRFRLHSDPLAVAWGWAIDDLSIQPEAVGLPDADGEDGPPELPRVVSLGRNTPNPFNPRTTIHYALPERSPVRLAVYDLRGRHVRTLVDEEIDGGEHSVEWDGRDRGGRSVASGVYFYRLDTPTRSFSRKMTLVE